MPQLNPTRPYNVAGFRISLVREPGVTLNGRPLLASPREAAEMLSKYIGERDREVFVIAMLTVRHRLIGVHTVSVGCLTGALVAPREVFKPAILAAGGSAAIILCHNHPSGEPEPSPEDIALTRRLAAAGSLLGIEVLDHLVLGEAGRYVSLKDRGVL